MALRRRQGDRGASSASKCPRRGTPSAARVEDGVRERAWRMRDLPRKRRAGDRWGRARYRAYSPRASTVGVSTRLRFCKGRTPAAQVSGDPDVASHQDEDDADTTSTDQLASGDVAEAGKKRKRRNASAARKAAARGLGATLDRFLALVGRLPNWLLLILLAGVVVAAFPFSLPDDKSITGATLDTGVVVWFVRLALIAVAVCVVAAAFFALRSIAAYIETGQWVTNAGPVGVADPSEELQNENQNLRNTISALRQRLAMNDEVNRRMLRVLKQHGLTDEVERFEEERPVPAPPEDVGARRDKAERPERAAIVQGEKAPPAEGPPSPAEGE